MQYDFGTINPSTKSGVVLADDLNKWRDALHTSHMGAARPGYVKPGMIWISSVGDPVYNLYLYDGAIDLLFGTYDKNTHVFTPGGIPDASLTVKGILEIATIAETDAAADQTRAMTPGIYGNSKFYNIGRQTILLQAGALLPHPTLGPSPVVRATANGQIYRALSYPDASVTYAGIAIPLPKKVDVTLAFNVRLRWTASSAGSVGWLIQYSTSGDGEAIDVVMTAAATLFSALGAINTQEVTAQISCAWPAGTVKEDTLYLDIARNGPHASDTVAAAVDLLNVEVGFMTDKGNDA